MKKIILLALVLSVLYGCGQGSTGQPLPAPSYTRTYIIDSCEYVGRVGYSRAHLAHKGNCRYCAERRKAELDDLIKRIKEE